MKRIALLFLSLLGASAAFAQAPAFTAAEYIDISNIRARHMVHGDMWWDPATGLAACEYPKGSGKNISFASALWIAGYDPQRNLHVSAQTYRQSGNDYWPGPIDPITNTTSYSTSADWAQIWKVNRSTIDSFRASFAAGGTVIPTVIKEWPAKGNAYSKGTSGNYLTIVETSGRDFAPFVDVNSDGKYNAADGDYPAIKGDQMLWWVTSDRGATHDASGSGDGLGIEIHNTAYAYHRGGAIDNTVFYEYELFNRSAGTYDSLRVGLWSDADLGNGFNDMIGYDSLRRMGVCYNGTTIDPVYGSSIPMMGIAMMELPADSTGYSAPAGSFSYYKNVSAGAFRNPLSPDEYNNLLSPAFTDGTHFPNNGRYALSLSQACDSGYTPDAQRFIISAKSRKLDAGTSLKVGMALVVCPNVGGCPNLSFGCLQATADTAFAVYHHPPATTTGIAAIPTNRSLHLYPNPAQDHLYFQSADGRTNGTVEVYDAAGKSVPAGLKRSVAGLELDVHALPAGAYHIIYSSGSGRESGLFIKR